MDLFGRSSSRKASLWSRIRCFLCTACGHASDPARCPWQRAVESFVDSACGVLSTVQGMRHSQPQTSLRPSAWASTPRAIVLMTILYTVHVDLHVGPGPCTMNVDLPQHNFVGPGPCTMNVDLPQHNLHKCTGTCT